MHQDVYLWDSGLVEDYYNFLNDNPNAIIGIAGIGSDAIVYTDICETKDKIERGHRANGKVIQVESLDECLFAMKREHFEQLKFDEKCCNDWHCYALEICLNNRIHGGKCFVVPSKVCHDSLGNSIQIGFVHTVKNIIWKYRKTNIDRIESTCIIIKCSKIAYCVYSFKYHVKSMIKFILKVCH